MALNVEPIEYGDHITRHDYYQPVYRVDGKFEPGPKRMVKAGSS